MAFCRTRLDGVNIDQKNETENLPPKAQRASVNHRDADGTRGIFQLRESFLREPDSSALRSRKSKAKSKGEVFAVLEVNCFRALIAINSHFFSFSSAADQERIS